MKSFALLLLAVSSLSLAQNNDLDFSRTRFSINKKLNGLSSIKSILGSDEFNFIQQRQGLTGQHIHLQEKINGLPVYGSYTSIHLNPDSSVDEVDMSRAILRKSMNFKSFIQTEENIIQQAINLIGSQPVSVPTVEKNLYMDNGEARTAWKVEFETQGPSRTWRILIDDQSGKILEKRDMNFYAEGKGWVFNPNPVVTSGLMDLKDDNNTDSAALTAERQEVILKNLDGSGKLVGKYVKINSAVANNVNLIFDFTRSQKEFEETMAYYHIDTMQSYIQSLGFTQINNRTIAVNVNKIPDDNSFYNSLTKEITFGTGGIDDAEDADIIYHESGHAILDNQVPGFGSSKEGLAMGEGFGDYWAASAFESMGPLGHTKDVFVGTWDAVAYNPAKLNMPAFLRRLDSTKHYPQDMVKESHADGEIWSGCLWQIHTALGKVAANKLILESHFYLNAKSGFVEGANAIIKADSKLFNSQNADTIKNIFKQRGILK